MENTLPPVDVQALPPEKPKGKPKTFQCPSCGGTVTIKAVGITISAVCANCNSVIDVLNENFKIIEKTNKETRNTIIDLGSKGQLFEVEWEVIGYVEKTDGSGDYHWEEYLLYNPYHGFRFLVQSNGHWNFVKVLRKDISGAGLSDEVWLGDKKYTIFLKGEAVVYYVKGEFYWRTKIGERVDVVDYIAPPYMLSVEKNDQEIIVALGEYIEPEEVAEAFKLNTEMPNKRGVAANQPAPYQGNFAIIWLVFFVALVLATTIQIISSSAADNKMVFDQKFNIYPQDKAKILSSPTFSLPKDSNVLIESYSPVQNDWVELNLSLVNEQNNDEYNILQAIEYYSGRDSDGNWSEGSTNTHSYLSSVASGNYRLLIEADSGSFQKNLPLNFSLRTKRDVPSWSNFWTTFLLLIFYPLFATLRRWSFESTRWSESDYAPRIYQRNEE